MPRWAWIVLIVIATIVVLQIAGYLVFNMGGSTPGSGEGEILQELTETTSP